LAYLFYASTMLFLLLWFCSRLWSQVFWYLQHCSFYSGLNWLFGVFCVSTWILFLFLWRMTLKFCWGLQWVTMLLF
jgi:hypothetical protein